MKTNNIKVNENTIRKAESFRRTTTKIALSLLSTLIALSTVGMTVFADNAENKKPGGIGGSSTMTTLVTAVFWVVRVLVVAFAVPCLPKAVKAKDEGDNREFSNNLTTMVVAGIAFAVTFVIQALI